MSEAQEFSGYERHADCTIRFSHRVPNILLELPWLSWGFARFGQVATNLASEGQQHAPQRSSAGTVSRRERQAITERRTKVCNFQADYL